MNLIDSVNFIWPIGWKASESGRAVLGKIYNLKRVTEILIEEYDSSSMFRYIAIVKQPGLRTRHVLFDRSIVLILKKCRDEHMAFTDSFEGATQKIKVVPVDKVSIGRRYKNGQAASHRPYENFKVRSRME